MIKTVTILLVSLTLIILPVGCSKQNISISIPTTVEKQNKIPEPYTLMLKQLESKNLDMAQKYADLVINDFKDTQYVYNATLIKSIINLSRMNVIKKKTNYIITGMHKVGSLGSEEDMERLQGHIENLQKELELYEPIYNETTQYLLDNFSDKDNVQLEFPAITDDMAFSEYTALDFFSTVGYPVPTNSEMFTGDRQNVLGWTFLMTKDFNDSSKFYIGYFYYLSINTDDHIMKKKVLNKIIELTEGDKYNEIRILAQEELNKLK